MKNDQAVPLPSDDASVPQMAASDPLPSGPFRVGMIRDGYSQRLTPPWTIKAANNQCVAGWIDSRECAVAIAAALNLQFPVARS